MTDICLPVAEAHALMGGDVDYMNALLGSGLLGFYENGLVSQTGLRHYIDYGTQWRSELGDRLVDSGYAALEHAGEINHPVSTSIRMRIHRIPNPDNSGRLC